MVPAGYRWFVCPNCPNSSTVVFTDLRILASIKMLRQAKGDVIGLHAIPRQNKGVAQEPLRVTVFVFLSGKHGVLDGHPFLAGESTVNDYVQ